MAVVLKTVQLSASTKSRRSTSGFTDQAGIACRTGGRRVEGVGLAEGAGIVRVVEKQKPGRHEQVVERRWGGNQERSAKGTEGGKLQRSNVERALRHLMTGH